MKFVKLFLFVFFGFHLNAQNIINAEKIDGQIKIDGILNEAVWQTATSVSDFIQNFPYDTSKVVQQTHVKICYNDQYLKPLLSFYFIRNKNFSQNPIHIIITFGSSDF